MKKHMDIILKTEDLCKYYGTGDNQVKAVDHVNLEIRQGEFVSIVGKSGSGKSTLLHMLGGLDNPTSGKVFIDGENIASFKEEKLSKIRRRKIGFIFQAYNLPAYRNEFFSAPQRFCCAKRFVKFSTACVPNIILPLATSSDVLVAAVSIQ